MAPRNKPKRTTHADQWDRLGACVAIHARQGRWDMAVTKVQEARQRAAQDARRAIRRRYDVPPETLVVDLPLRPSTKHFLKVRGIRTLADLSDSLPDLDLPGASDLSYDIRLVLAGLESLI